MPYTIHPPSISLSSPPLRKVFVGTLHLMARGMTSRSRRMLHLNLDAFNSLKPLGHALGEVDGAMLASCAAEGDLKVIAAIVEIFIDRLANERFRRAEKAIHLVLIVVEEVANWLVAAGVSAQQFVPVRIRHRPAVEHKATRIAGLVLHAAVFFSLSIAHATAPWALR